MHIDITMLYAVVQLTLPGVGVSSHLFLRGVGPSAGLPGVGVASHRLPAPGVAPGVASQWAAGVAPGVAPGVASQLLVAGVASTVSQSATFAFLLQQQNVLSVKALSTNVKQAVYIMAWCNIHVMICWQRYLLPRTCIFQCITNMVHHSIQDTDNVQHASTKVPAVGRM